MNAQNLINRLVARKLQSAGNTEAGNLQRALCGYEGKAKAPCGYESNAGAIRRVRVACVWSQPTAR